MLLFYSTQNHILVHTLEPLDEVRLSSSHNIRLCGDIPIAKVLYQELKNTHYCSKLCCRKTRLKVLLKQTKRKRGPIVL